MKPLMVHFKTTFSPDTVMVMNEEDLTEETVDELGITEFWFQVQDNTVRRDPIV